ncbi:MAG TPA: hypothetical protein VEA80_00670 [Vitreimonas sp.]|uniref:hypothetical protein n=1 Tax=Vitreimonas sp. TaxID=3069702 RepID=UPI002D2AF337|nr:hypothetical protein [Vitreimonas sp.]HYD85963.1 hypothetical protein [Vitreimonas sp.]
MTLVQVCLRVRKAAAASIPIARLAESKRLSRLSPTDKQQLSGLAAQAHTHLQSALNAPADLDGLCAGEAGALGAFANLFVPALSAGAKAEAHRCEAALRAPKCANCVGRSATGNPTCNDGLKDDETVAAGPTCLAELVEAMKFAKTVSEALIEDALSQEIALELRLHTKFNAGVYTVAGACVHTDAATASDNIEFFLPELGFDYVELSKAPYMFAHEIICHAAQALHNFSGAPRPQGPVYCPWSEGWMDCVAAQALSDALLQRALTAPAWMDEEASGCIDGTDAAHMARSPRQAPNNPLYVSQQNEARIAFTMFERVAAIAGLTALAADDLRRRFSILYNTLPRPHSERAALAINLTARVNETDLTRAEDLVKACETFLKDRDAVSFVNKI